MICVAILTTWIIMPAILTIMGFLGTDIVYGTCIPWGVYSSYALQKAMMSLSAALSYVVPLTVMLFCYSRIVYALRHKVTNYCNRRVKNLTLYGTLRVVTIILE